MWLFGVNDISNLYVVEVVLFLINIPASCSSVFFTEIIQFELEYIKKIKRIWTHFARLYFKISSSRAAETLELILHSYIMLLIQFAVTYVD